MSTIRSLLCAVDFSKPSEHALRHAIALAEALGAELHVVHVYTVPVYALPDGALVAGPQWTARIMSDAEQQMKALLERVETGSVKVTPHVLEGVPHEEIPALARKLGVDLLVAGTHGRTGLAHLLLGSVAERIVRTADRPVLTVRPPAEP